MRESAVQEDSRVDLLAAPLARCSAEEGLKIAGALAVRLAKGSLLHGA